MTDRVVTYTLRGQVGDLTAKMAATSASVRKVASDMTALDAAGAKTRANLSAVGDTAGRMGLAVSLGVGLIAKAAIDWESAWAGVTKTVDGTSDQLAELEGGLRGLATTLPATHKEIAAVAEAAGQLGVAREDILTFTKTMVDLGETTNLTADEAATSIAQLANVMGTTGDEIDNLGSVLVALGNDGASTERDIIQMAQRIAGAGKTVGLSEGEVLAFANSVASMGIEVEAGGTAVSTVFAKMARAAASGGPRLESFAETAGTSAAKFAKSFKEDPAEALVSFIKGLEATQKAGGNLYAQLDAVGLADVRVSAALVGMASNVDLVTGSLDLQAAEWERNKALTDEAAKRYDTTAAKTQVAWNNIKDEAIDAGAAMLPIISGIADGVGAVGDAFDVLPDFVTPGLTVLASVGGVGLLATAGILKLSTAVAGARVQMTDLSKTSPRLASGLSSVSRAAGVASVALGALRAVGELLDTDSTASVEKYTAAILDLGNGTKRLDGILSNSKGLVSQAKGLSDLSAAIKEADPGGFNKTMGSAFGLIKMNPYQDAIDDVKAYDDALTGLVSQGAVKEAAEGQVVFAKAAREAGKSTEDIKELLPNYYDALLDVDNGQRITGDSARTLAGATTQLTAAQEEAQSTARAQAEEIVNIGEAAADTKGDLDKFRDQLIEQAKAMRNLRVNSEEAGKKGVSEGLIAELQSAGPEGAAILANLANASQSEIDKINDAFRRGQIQIEKFADAADDPINVQVRADTIDAMNKLAGFMQYVRGINGTVVRVSVKGSSGITTHGADGYVMDYYADGAVIQGRAENHVAQIAPAGAMRVWAEPETGGEAYIPFAMSKRKRSQEIAMQTVSRLGGVAAFANGGITGGSSSGGGYARLVDRSLKVSKNGLVELMDDRVELVTSSNDNYRAGRGRGGSSR